MIVLRTKKCKGKGGCGKVFTLDRFFHNHKTADLFHNICKDCFQRRFPQNKLYQSDHHRRKKYKLSQDDLEVWLCVPVCQVTGCGYKFKNDSDVHFDHDHEKGHVRGVLCPFHNGSIRSEAKAGRDTVEDLLAMVDYVKRDRERLTELN